MLIDSLGVLSKEAKRDGKSRPIYQEEDVDKAMSLGEAKNYRESFEIGGINVLFKDAGHILGSAIIGKVPIPKNWETRRKKRNWFFPAIWAIFLGTAYQSHGNYK